MKCRIGGTIFLHTMLNIKNLRIMKKIFFIMLAFTCSFGAIAQGNGKGKGHNKQKKSNQERVYNNERNESVNDRIFRGDNNNVNTGGKYTNSTPRKVRDAFYRDYPNASNVSWTKDRGVWTARFNGGGIFGGGNSVSYKANGQRLGSYNDNTVYRRDNDRNSGGRTTTTQRSGTSVWDRVIQRRQ
jgi:hypothetical protein